VRHWPPDWPVDDDSLRRLLAARRWDDAAVHWLWTRLHRSVRDQQAMLGSLRLGPFDLGRWREAWDQLVRRLEDLGETMPAGEDVPLPF
jgi:hypothetical protein